MQFTDLHAQQERIKDKIDANIQRVLAHGKYTFGPEVAELEEQLANFVGAKYCITCANSTDARQTSQMALGVGAGDKVIAPGFSYIATAETVTLLSAKRVYVDINARTYNLEPTLLEAAITPKKKAIIPVSLYGQCADFYAINAIAQKHNIPVIEGATQSFGATYKGRNSCNLSAIACTSFSPSKPYGCYGDDGALFTNDDELAIICRQISRQWQEHRYYHIRLDTLQAAITAAKFETYEQEINKRQEIAEHYIHLLNKMGNKVTPYIGKYNTSVWVQYTIQVPGRGKLNGKLANEKNSTFVHYPVPLSRRQAVLNEHVELPAGDRVAELVIGLPMHPYLSKASVAQIVFALKY